MGERKFLVTGVPLRQVFEPYTGSHVPVFITSDSILNAYHVLLEESIYRMEVANSRKLPGILDRLAKNLDATAAGVKGDEALVKGAKRRAAIFLCVARNLLDEKALPDDAGIKAEVQSEVKRVLAGNDTSKPAWLGPPDDGFLAIDYSRFTPRGFYTRTPALQRYFRAIAWQQAIPFRADRDEELAAIALMHETFFGVRRWTYDDLALMNAFRVFLGDQDDWDIRAAKSPEEWTAAGLVKLRKLLADEDKRGKAQINDQLRFAPTEPGAKAELAFRFLSVYRLPDAVMFHRTMRLKDVKRDFPSGLEVAAVLGSPFARDHFKSAAPKLLAEIDATKPLFKGKNLYADYLRCLSVLVERTEPDARAFMRAEPWRIKTAQTALAGWAQMRHTWVLQAKQSEEYISESLRMSGFVEPVPEFYGNLTVLINATAKALYYAGAMDVVHDYAAEQLDELRAVQEIVKKAIDGKAALNSFTRDEQRKIERFSAWLVLAEKDEPAAKVLEKIRADLTTRERVLKDAKPGEPEPGGESWPLRPTWTALAELCQRLEYLSHKQLRQVPFRADENKFILDYGRNLAGIMFYGGNSYFDPRDDVMRVVDVYSARGAHLHVGIARPRVMWVLYPTKAGEVLCHGAIVPYAEFVHGTRLTDCDWKALLDSPKKPEIPTWAKEVIPPERAKLK